MELKKLLLYFTVTAATVSAQTSNITYHVIASPATTDMSVAVIIDNQTFPLSKEGILYSGQAPISQSGYQYAFLDAQQHIQTIEPFSRAPVESDTLYEFFNRSLNTFNVSNLPQIYTPISDRLVSELHNRTYIPTMHLWGNESAIKVLHENQTTNENTVSLNLTFYSLNDVQRFENVEVQLAGRSSRRAAKLSYGLKMKSKGEDSLYGYKKLKLRALAMDPTYIREYVAYSTLAAAGIPASGFSYVRLFMNGQPVGLFGLIETFQDPWLANEFAKGDSTYESGNLYQGSAIGQDGNTTVFSDLSYFENTTLYSLGEYQVKAGPAKSEKKPEKVYKELQEFTKFIHETSENTTVGEWEKRINTEGFVRAMTVEDMLGLSDAYMTLADNYYVYNDPTQPGRMIYIPTDMDTSLGSGIIDIALMLSGNYSEHPGFLMRPLTTKLFANQELLSSYQDKFKNLSQNLIHPSIMNPFIDDIVQVIRNDVEWDQTLPRLGQTSTVNLASTAGQGQNLTGLLPPGFMTHSGNVTIDTSTVNGVKRFLSEKSANIRAFYNL